MQGRRKTQCSEHTDSATQGGRLSADAQLNHGTWADEHSITVITRSSAAHNILEN